MQPDGSIQYGYTITREAKLNSIDSFTQRYQTIGTIYPENISPYLFHLTEDIITHGATPVFYLLPMLPMLMIM